jgi:hypothetical protein
VASAASTRVAGDSASASAAASEDLERREQPEDLERAILDAIMPEFTCPITTSLMKGARPPRGARAPAALAPG